MSEIKLKDLDKIDFQQLKKELDELSEKYPNIAKKLCSMMIPRYALRK